MLRITALALALTGLSLQAGAQARGDVVGPGARTYVPRGEQIARCQQMRARLGEPHLPAAEMARIREYLVTHCP